MDIDVGHGFQLQPPNSPKQVTPLFAKFFKEREVVEPEKEPSLGEGDLDKNVTTLGNCNVTVMNGSGLAKHETPKNDKAPMVTDNDFAADLNLRCFEASLAVPYRSHAKIKKGTSYATSGAEFGATGKVFELLISKMELVRVVERKIDFLYLLEYILQASGMADPAKNEYMAWVAMELSRIVRAILAESLGSVKLEKILKIWEQRVALSEDVLKSARELMESLEPCGGSGLTSN